MIIVAIRCILLIFYQYIIGLTHWDIINCFNGNVQLSSASSIGGRVLEVKHEGTWNI